MTHMLLNFKILTSKPTKMQFLISGFEGIKESKIGRISFGKDLARFTAKAISLYSMTSSQMILNKETVAIAISCHVSAQ